jgi:DNA-binding MarR family transcriptional regulator
MVDNLNKKDTQLSRSSEEIVRSLQREISEVLAFAAAMARRTGLGLSEMAALEHLQHAARGPEGGLTPTELGRRLSLSSGAVTALVDRLEGAGRVERSPHPRDRRSSVVRVKPSGVEEALRHMIPLQRELMEVTAGLTDDEREAVGRYLQTVTEIFMRHARGPE